MDRGKPSKQAMALATGLIIGGVALTTLCATGCDNGSAQQAAALVAGSPRDAADQPENSPKMELLSRLVGNHNETFLISATA